MFLIKTARTLVCALLTTTTLSAQAQGRQALHLYSARHYQTDEALYREFTRATGVRINRVDSNDAGILARLKTEGSASPADVILLVDAARLWRAENEGLFLPLRSAVLVSRIPATLRGRDDGLGSAWFGFSTRARVVVFSKQHVKSEDVDTYEELANAKNKGKVCTRSGSHPYNLSLFGAVLEHLGAQATELWLKGLVDNMARSPKGGDTDQIKAVASGECQIALTNTYYLARLMRSNKVSDRGVVKRIGVVFPNQLSWGTHVNVAGGAVARHTKNLDAARKFLEYLASDKAQVFFADGNNEWPAVADVKPSNPALAAWGNFRTDTISVATIGQNQIAIQKMLDRVGYK